MGKRQGIPIRLAVSMVLSYAGSRVTAQLKAVSFLVFFLAGFQLAVVRRPLPDALSVALGIGGVLLGLSFFLEGLMLGIMPLGEKCGLHVPARTGKAGILLFSVVIGAAATIAEPAIVFLQAQGAGISPWQAPMLYLLLNRGSMWLVGAIAAGVGVAVAYGVFRFLMGWSLKPFLFLVIPLLGILTYFVSKDPAASPVLGLAWDTGGVTTGPVTVPLIIALGVGVSRFSGKGNNEFGGLGVVTAASALPVLAVMILMFVLSPMVPGPTGPEEFFSASGREKAVFVTGSEAALRKMAKDVLPGELFEKAFPDGEDSMQEENGSSDLDKSIHDAIKNSVEVKKIHVFILNSIRALVPLTLILFVILRLLSPGHQEGLDEIILGLFFAVTGMFLFSWGMERGLDVLGREAGRSLPAVYTVMERPEEAIVLKGINNSAIIQAAGEEGTKEYIAVEEGGRPVFHKFDRSRFDEGRGVYTHVPEKRPLLSYAPIWAGFAAIFIFVFSLGYGATLAEPSLTALGATVEELSTGTYRQNSLVRTVALGVGIGMAAGFAGILFSLPFFWMIVIPYSAALVLTAVSSEEFVSVAWDSAGVTTGPLTVPLVLAAGLGVGEAAGAAGSFGVVASASVYPILTVLLTGLIKGRKNSRLYKNSHRQAQGGMR